MVNFIYLGLLVIYLLLILYTVIRILLDTNSTPKTFGYLLLVLLLPIAGVAIYIAFGLNFRHLSSRYRLKKAQEELDADMKRNTDDSSVAMPSAGKEEAGNFSSLIEFLKFIGNEPLLESYFTLLNNGEEKFPEVLRVLESAKQFIHLEYYAWENDIRGNEIKDVLLSKAKEGVKIRVLYDAYASRKIKGNIVKELKAGGVLVFPKIKVKLVQLANRLNHRDHRKIIIVDGVTGFVGGINISDRYDNSIDTGLYWRDTHVKIEGLLVNSLQRHFIVSWNSCQTEKLTFSQDLFPKKVVDKPQGLKAMGQVVAGGPVYPMSNIMLTYFKIFTSARNKLYITNPYFIPNDSIMDALKQAAISGVDVRLMLPFKSDSTIVGAASKFYLPDLIQAGVKIYLYKKGFVHAKTVVADTHLSVIGTANMDVRSFDLNFEIMSVIYGEEFSKQVEKAFLNDLNECMEITAEIVARASLLHRLFYAVTRLISSLL
ncbi:MAG: cardiolipin synthase [Bacteroidales bacterium]